MATSTDILNIATAQVGSYGRPNKFTDWYGFSDNWCDMFVSWAFNEAGALSAIGGKFALTTAHAKWFQSQGLWGTTPQIGACVFFDWNGGKSISGIDHIGIVRGIGNSAIETVEGNTGDNQVALRTRSTGLVVGYGYPKLDGNPMPAGGVNVIPVGNPFSAVKGAAEVLSNLSGIAGKALNPKWWERIGIGALGLIVVALGIVFMKRRQIETQISKVAKVATVA